MEKMDTLKAGIYKHYKGEEYIVYGVVLDENNEEYVLYTSKENTNLFWVRKYLNFFGPINEETTTRRFVLIEKDEPVEFKNKLNNLKSLILTNNIIIKSKEDEITEYVITTLKISTSSIIRISKLKLQYGSSYLNDFQIALRMGWIISNLNEEYIFNQCKNIIEPNRQLLLSVERDLEINDKSIIKKQLNPCSIDLHISDVFFCKTKRGKIDLMAIDSRQCYDNLWQKVKLKRGNDIKYVLLKPNESLITKTLEKISIPEDCAGKIEIKSTYGRLSLSITSSDFCNPGWSGFFPLQIKNESNHIIKIYPSETMIQLMLLPLKSESVIKYQKDGSYIDDDGTPRNFWNAKSVRELKKKYGDEKSDYFYDKKVKKYSDSLDEQDRFIHTFLSYCEKKKLKYKTDDDKVDYKKIYNSYITRENSLNFLFGKGGIASGLGLEIFTLLISAIFNIPNLATVIIAIIVLIIYYSVFIILKNKGIIPNHYCISKRE